MAQRDEGFIASRPSLIRWGPSFGGAIATIAVTACVMALWLAIGYGSGVRFFVHDAQWFFLGTALGSILLGGAIAGWVSGVRGPRTGFFTGMSVWGLVIVATLIPLSLRALALANNSGSLARGSTDTVLGLSSGNLWALFGALVGGFFCAVIGASTGASMGSSGETHATTAPPVTTTSIGRAGRRRVASG
jgi:hypothetical protein